MKGKVVLKWVAISISISFLLSTGCSDKGTINEPAKNDFVVKSGNSFNSKSSAYDIWKVLMLGKQSSLAKVKEDCELPFPLHYAYPIDDELIVVKKTGTTRFYLDKAPSSFECQLGHIHKFVRYDFCMNMGEDLNNPDYFDNDHNYYDADVRAFLTAMNQWRSPYLYWFAVSIYNPACISWYTNRNGGPLERCRLLYWPEISRNGDVISWPAVAWADHYTIKYTEIINNGISGSQEISYFEDVSQTSISLPEFPTSNYIVVKAVSIEGLQSEWSDAIML